MGGKGSFHSFRRWLEVWLKGMIKWTTGPGQPVFQALVGVLKFDLPLMMFLLPEVKMILWVVWVWVPV